MVVDQTGCETEPQNAACIRPMLVSEVLDEAEISRLRGEFALFNSREASVDVYFDHDASGHVVRAGIVRPKGIEYIDKEILQYVRSSSITATSAGSVKMRLHFLKLSASEPRIDDAAVIQVRGLTDQDSHLVFSKDVMRVFLSVDYQRLDSNVPEDFFRFQIEYDAFGKVIALHGNDDRMMRSLIDFFRSFESRFRLFPKSSLPLQPGSVRVRLYPDGSLVLEESVD